MSGAKRSGPVRPPHGIHSPSDMGHDEAALQRLFEEESAENLSAMENALLALETDPGDAGKVPELFRAAHTLKGNSASLGLTETAAVAHVVEDVLHAVREGRRAVDSDLVGVMLEAVDHLRGLVGGAVLDGEGLRERLAGLLATGRAEATSTALASAIALPSTRRTLRVDLDTLDRLLDLTGEIAVARGRLRTAAEAGALGEVVDAERGAERLHVDLQELVMRARLVPVGPTFASCARAVRDAAASLGKDVRLVAQGDQVEVDARVVELMRDPLAHLVRNAVAHGIEPVSVREAAGKDKVGTLLLRARRETGSIVVELEDDGAGLDTARIFEIARSRGLATGAEQLADAERLIFEPGFSTRDAADDVAGRGVGLDVVRRNVDALRGSITVRSVPGRGTTFVVRLPLTLAIVPGFGLEVGGESFVVPLDAVVECFDFTAPAHRATGFIEAHGTAVPWLRLRHCLGLAGGVASREQVVIADGAGGRVGLVADRLTGETQAVVKPLGRLLDGVAGLSGSTLLGDGRVALLLDVPALRRVAEDMENMGRSGGPEEITC
jgi:two-component system chemotaxis sensor kinase CheA